MLSSSHVGIVTIFSVYLSLICKQSSLKFLQSMFIRHLSQRERVLIKRWKGRSEVASGVQNPKVMWDDIYKVFYSFLLAWLFGFLLLLVMLVFYYYYFLLFFWWWGGELCFLFVCFLGCLFLFFWFFFHSSISLLPNSGI